MELAEVKKSREDGILAHGKVEGSAIEANFPGGLGFSKASARTWAWAAAARTAASRRAWTWGRAWAFGLQGNVAVTVDGKAIFEQFQKLMSTVDHEQHARRQRAATTSDHLINTMSGMAF